MEHNEYAVHEVKIQYRAKLQIRDSNDDFVRWDIQPREERFWFVAPTACYHPKHRGKQLLALHLDLMFAHGEPLGESPMDAEGGMYRIVEHKEHKLEAIVRFSSQYRDRI